MSAPKSPPKNRYLPGAHVSERTLTKIIYCWLDGLPYSAIPNALSTQNSSIDASIDQFAKALGETFSLRENDKRSVSRQSCHALINQVSATINILAYQERVETLRRIYASEPDSQEHSSKRRMDAFQRANEASFEHVFIEPAKSQTIAEYMANLAELVRMLSADDIPYKEIRKHQSIQPFDIIENQLLLDRMKTRFKAFRGYKLKGMASHVAHYLLLRFGTHLSISTDVNREDFNYRTAPKDECETYWSNIVLNGTLVALLMLRTHKGYNSISEIVSL